MTIPSTGPLPPRRLPPTATVELRADRQPLTGLASLLALFALLGGAVVALAVDRLTLAVALVIVAQLVLIVSGSQRSRGRPLPPIPAEPDAPELPQRSVSPNPPRGSWPFGQREQP